MTDHYTSQAAILEDLSETIHKLGLKWLSLEVTADPGAKWAIRGSVGYDDSVKVSVAQPNPSLLFGSTEGEEGTHEAPTGEGQQPQREVEDS